MVCVSRLRLRCALQGAYRHTKAHGAARPAGQRAVGADHAEQQGRVPAGRRACQGTHAAPHRCHTHAGALPSGPRLTLLSTDPTAGLRPVPGAHAHHGGAHAPRVLLHCAPGVCGGRPCNGRHPHPGAGAEADGVQGNQGRKQPRWVAQGLSSMPGCLARQPLVLVATPLPGCVRPVTRRAARMPPAAAFVFESEDAFLQRLEGMMTLYGAIVQVRACAVQVHCLAGCLHPRSVGAHTLLQWPARAACARALPRPARPMAAARAAPHTAAGG